MREIEEEKVVAQAEIEAIEAELQEAEQECNELEAVLNVRAYYSLPPSLFTKSALFF